MQLATHAACKAIYIIGSYYMLLALTVCPLSCSLVLSRHVPRMDTDVVVANGDTILAVRDGACPPRTS